MTGEPPRSKEQPPLKRCEVKCAWMDHGRPATRALPGYIVSEVFAVRASNAFESLRNSWMVIHRPSGFSAGYAYRTRAIAAECARELEAAYPAKYWRFKTPPRRMKNTDIAKAIIKRFSE